METPKMETRLNRPILVCVLLAAAAAALGAQEASQPSQSNPYEGTSSPPPNDAIVTSEAPQAKPRAGKPVHVQPQAPVQAEQQPSSVDPATGLPHPDTDDGIVKVSPDRPALTERAYADDPDGDIVHPHPPRRGELGEGTTIRVRLLQRLSTSESEKDEAFRTSVATDVLQDGEVLIPAGAEIDGRVVQISSGHPGGRGSMRLEPETVILPGGSRYRLHAETSGTPGSRTRVGGEGTILPNSRLRRDGIEYGGAVGAGAVTGAILGGPAGAATGGLIGAGVVTVHLLVSHPQATLETGATLIFTLTEPLDLIPATESRN